MKQQPTLNCYAATETTISGHKVTYCNIVNSTETKIFKQGKYSFVLVSIIARPASDINGIGENTTENLGSRQKVIPKCNVITETASWSYKIINKHFFASFNNDRGLSLDDKTKDYADKNTGGQVNSLYEVTQLG